MVRLLRQSAAEKDGLVVSEIDTRTAPPEKEKILKPRAARVLLRLEQKTGLPTNASHQKDP